MLFLKIVLIFIEVVGCILLVCVILLQRAKSQGLGLAFGAEMGESLFGARASNILVKTTIYLGIIVLVNTTILARIYARGQGSSVLSRGASAPVEQPAPPVAPVVPAALPAAGQQTPVAPPAAPPVPAVPAASETGK